ncbi:MAG: HPF/RaiA family ribosome-associated protein [Archangium sp.]|nr:HPF/RaiA family ribosome-associated protein [Archangium sp.]MDP3151945.1 HPF/RaiA family ribosome-associated protein [Archangium sp.]MDP3571358.1 HPF/RaiA family ribosome-associated protein [Archangium sp.]
MKIEVRFRELETSAALQSHAERQVHFHLSRFGSELSSVVVRLSRVKGSTFTQCKVTVRGARLRGTTLSLQSGDPVTALSHLMQRLGREVGLELDGVRDELLRGKPS